MPTSLCGKSDVYILNRSSAVTTEIMENTREKAFMKPDRIYDACPLCGWKLSPWQQVLLAIDRALVCKNCWYRIILDISDSTVPTVSTELSSLRDK